MSSTPSWGGNYVISLLSLGLWGMTGCGVRLHVASHRAGPPSLPERSVLQRPAASRRDVEVGLLRLLTGFGSVNKLSVGIWLIVCLCLSLFPV